MPSNQITFKKCLVSQALTSFAEVFEGGVPATPGTDAHDYISGKLPPADVEQDQQSRALSTAMAKSAGENA